MEKENKRVLRVELDDNVKQVSITAKNADEKVVMRQELSEDDLELATGGESFDKNCPRKQLQDFEECRRDRLDVLLYPTHP